MVLLEGAENVPRSPGPRWEPCSAGSRRPVHTSRWEAEAMDRGRVLVVDDEESIRFTFETFLAEEGYSVATAMDFASALGQLAGQEFGVAFVDIILGGKSGLDLLSELRTRSPATEVVLITGAPSIESASEALRLGAFDYLVKPVRQDALLRAADIAFRHKAVSDSKERYRRNIEAIFRSVRDAIVTVDQHLNLVEANRAAEDLCGLRRDDKVGKPLKEWGLTCDQSCLQAALDTIARGEPVELEKVRCSGRLRPFQVVSVTATPLIDHAGAPTGGVLVLRDETRLVELEKRLRERTETGPIVGRSPGIRRVLSMVEALGGVDTSVLLTGESGTGKGLVAEALHTASGRAAQPLVKVNCSALSETLLESELFGHVRGAFTGADRNKVGRFERARGGTIFLDEIGDITPRMQLRFLRVLESKEFERVGDSVPIKVDLRVIAATNRNLKELVSRGDFREDLFYRLKVFEIPLPPLRERREDIPALVEHFLQRFDVAMSKHVRSVADDVMELFLRHRWPGNVRELENTLEHAFVLCREETIRRVHLPVDFVAAVEGGLDGVAADGGAAPSSGGEILPLTEVESRYLEWAVATHEGDRSSLAHRLGLSERTLYRKVRGIRRDDD